MLGPSNGSGVMLGTMVPSYDRRKIGSFQSALSLTFVNNLPRQNGKRYVCSQNVGGLAV